jgi:hypothetical protein
MRVLRKSQRETETLGEGFRLEGRASLAPLPSKSIRNVNWPPGKEPRGG